jgi:hypothetical protein
VSRNPLLIDAGIALALAILVIVVSPGLAVVGLLAIFVLLVCGLSFGIDRWRRRRPRDPVAELQRSRAAERRTARRAGENGQARRSPSRR